MLWAPSLCRRLPDSLFETAVVPPTAPRLLVPAAARRQASSATTVRAGQLCPGCSIFLVPSPDGPAAARVAAVLHIIHRAITLPSLLHSRAALNWLTVLCLSGSNTCSHAPAFAPRAVRDPGCDS